MGIFFTVGERLSAGDRLYVDIWDNKDPLFYWSLGIIHYLDPWLHFVVELIFIVISCASVYSICRSLNLSTSYSVLLGFSFTAAVITGIAYFAGYTHLPGEALSFLVVALTIRKFYFSAGLVVGLVIFWKIVLAPIAFFGLALGYIVNTSRTVIDGLTIIGSIALSTIVIVLIMITRGEFAGYVESILANLNYSNNPLLPGDIPNFIGHYKFILQQPDSTEFLLLAIIAMALVLNSFWMARTSRDRSYELEYINYTALVSLILGFLAVGFTAYWDHHLQVLNIGIVLALLAWIRAWISHFKRANRHVLFAALVVCLISYIPIRIHFDQGTPSRAYSKAIKKLKTYKRPTRAGLALLTMGEQGAYARLGGNNRLPPLGSAHNWKLACPRFQVYPFDTAEILEPTKSCIESNLPVILLADFPSHPEMADYMEFRTWALEFLEARYDCRVEFKTKICSPKPG